MILWNIYDIVIMRPVRSEGHIGGIERCARIGSCLLKLIAVENPVVLRTHDRLVFSHSVKRHTPR